MAHLSIRALALAFVRTHIRSRAGAWCAGTLHVSVVLVVLTAVPVAAQGLSRDEALSSVYPGAMIRPERVFLTPAQQSEAAARAGVDVPSALVARYIATREGTVVGRSYVDTHTVRTKRESLLVSLDSRGQVLRIDVTAFLEPPEYMAPEAWLRQYRGRGLTAELAIDRAIRPISGATLTTRVANNAVRRVLAIDDVLERGGGRP